ncbi:mitochondrial calcium uniporter regulator 1-like isoform X1 [Hypanus sabinus]|uniref:mitochondrial calcium uniporter regulator 1-like isoform X1 n=1 Tax=Hypanus sabinus TaxID=79690 RepID=UPI0028C4B9B1|nr:mitochondrial calcium uniporter regulator 1-like isoform X1 [Hypanus sabinus]
MTVVCVRRWRPLLPRTVFAAARGGDDGARGPRCVQVQVGRRQMQRGLSLSVISLHYNSRRMSSVEGQKFYFDTHAVVRHLEECGFSSKQSEVVVAALMRVMNSNMEITYKDMATKNQQELMLQQIMSYIAAVKKDMIILEKSEFSALRAANEKLKIELQQLKKQLTDEVVKVSSNNKLDLNLEKGRVQEMLTEHEKKVLETKADIVEVHSQQERAVTQVNQKIDTEVAGLKTLLESHKLDTIKYLAGSVFTCLTVVLGFYRLWV